MKLEIKIQAFKGDTGNFYASHGFSKEYNGESIFFSDEEIIEMANLIVKHTENFYLLFESVGTNGTSYSKVVSRNGKDRFEKAKNFLDENFIDGLVFNKNGEEVSDEILSYTK